MDKHASLVSWWLPQVVLKLEQHLIFCFNSEYSIWHLATLPKWAGGGRGEVKGSILLKIKFLFKNYYLQESKEQMSFFK